MNSVDARARTVGVLYLASAIAAGIPLVYVPSKLIVSGDGRVTLARILASETLFRASIISELLGALLLFATVCAIFRLFGRFNRELATLMFILAVLSLPITFICVTFETASLAVSHSATIAKSFTNAQQGELVLFLLSLHGDVVTMANILWALWLLPLGLLVMQSRAIPRLLGIWLLADCIALVTVSLVAILSPPRSTSSIG